jgi:hypothetical protein
LFICSYWNAWSDGIAQAIFRSDQPIKRLKTDTLHNVTTEDAMKDLLITRSHLTANGRYVGDIDLSSFNGNLKLSDGLGDVYFASINVTGSVVVGRHCTLRVKENLCAGNFIHAEENIVVEGDISAGLFIKTGVRLRAGGDIRAVLDIQGDWGIYAGGLLKAGSDIMSRGLIETGGAIEAGATLASGSDVMAGDYITTGLCIRVFRNVKAGGIVRAGKELCVGGRLDSELNRQASLVG